MATHNLVPKYYWPILRNVMLHHIYQDRNVQIAQPTKLNYIKIN